MRPLVSGTYYQPSSHSFELVFPADFQVDAPFTEQVLTAFQLSHLASENSSRLFFKKRTLPAYDSEQAIFQVWLDRGYQISYPRWNKWIVWRSALELALDGLIQHIVEVFCSNYIPPAQMPSTLS